MNADVLYRVFDVVDFPTLSVSSHVSRLWRTCARRHPAFWKRLCVDDSTPLTSAAVQLFLDRLESKASTDLDATILLTMRCTTPSPDVICLILPAVSRHVRRLEEIAIVTSRALVSHVWPLFRLDAPRLRNIQVSVNRPGPQPAPLPAIFNAHRFTSLERVVLLDVPLPACADPVEHVLKGVKAVYSDDCSHLARFASWFPRSQTQDLRLCRGRRHELDLRYFPMIGPAQLEFQS
ncbi:hypothetical protein AURDEDRAFT_172652 [Auricularia subglabra TFB-10046 SS5]|nr:hypothetical protein AURDEDRAFT_172652 [Auricularia subglabra TFB-10046 SS5]